MLRIHFGADDLRRTRFAVEPEPLWETMLGIYALGGRVPAQMRGWRNRARPRLHPGMRPLLSLFSPNGLFPDFLVPEVSGMRAGLAALDRTPPARIHDELVSFLPDRCHNRYHAELIAGNDRARRELRTAITLVHDSLIVPISAAIERRLAADLAVRSHNLLDNGIESTLATLHPHLSWRSPVLLSTPLCGPVVTDVHLNGRGLLLYPTVFTASSIVVDQPDRIPILFYPALDTGYADPPDPAALADLLGRTRADVLTAVSFGASTSELARRTGISPASASEHARVLRRSGLVETRRVGQSAVHTLTPLARSLLGSVGFDPDQHGDGSADVLGNATA